MQRFSQTKLTVKCAIFNTFLYLSTPCWNLPSELNSSSSQSSNYFSLVDAMPVYMQLGLTGIVLKLHTDEVALDRTPEPRGCGVVFLL